MVLNGSSHDSTALKKKMPICNSVENLNCFYLIFFENSETLSFNSFSLFALVLNFSIVNCWSIVDCSYLKTQITIFYLHFQREYFSTIWLISIWINVWGSVEQQLWNPSGSYLVLAAPTVALAALAKSNSKWVERSTLHREK